METSRISLADAMKSGRLSDFINQAEREGVGEVSADDFAIALEALIKAPLPKDQTSRLPLRGASRGK